MDDTTVMCSNEAETRRRLESLTGLMSWCKMNYKPKESRSFSGRKSEMDAVMTLTVANKEILTVSEESV